MSRIRAWIVILGIAQAWMGLIVAQSALAKPRKVSKTPPKLEVYSATEADGAAVPAQFPPAAQAPAPIAKAPVRKQRQAPGKVSSAPAQETAAKKEPAYFLVGPEQATAIARRLNLVERLLREYGRVYDYRAHTVRELEGILSELDEASASVPAAEPAPEAAEG